MNQKKILFLGYRKGALLAAKRLGLHVDLACLGGEAPPSHSYPMHCWHSNNEEDLIKMILSSSTPHNYQSVLALNERSVSLAGHLREKWKISGINEETADACHYKDKMKIKAAKAGISVTPHLVIFKDDELEKQKQMNECISHWGWPLVVKALSLSGSRGMTICHDRQQLSTVWEEGKMVEAYIRGQEMSIESFVFEGEICWTNVTAYHRLLEMNIVPSLLSKQTFDLLMDFNQKVLRAFRIDSGMTHVELYLTEWGPVLGEIAVRPPGGYILELIRLAYNFDPWEALLKIEMGEKPKFPVWQGQYAGSWIIHPGKGHIAQISGLSEIRKIGALKKWRLKVKEGDLISDRLGSGIEVGHALFQDFSYQKVAHAMETAKTKLIFSFESTTNKLND